MMVKRTNRPSPQENMNPKSTGHYDVTWEFAITRLNAKPGIFNPHLVLCYSRIPDHDYRLSLPRAADPSGHEVCPFCDNHFQAWRKAICPNILSLMSPKTGYW